jgi:hypothetical protein
MSNSKDEILEMLRVGNLDALIGEFENEWLECKRQPYGLESDIHKMELAKDVAGLANARGGLILIGFSTTRSATHGMDQIDGATPFPINMFDPTRYNNILADWLWPPIENIRFDLFPSATDSTKCVAVIVVPSVSGPDKPVLVAKTILDSPRRVEILFGYCERKQAQVNHHDVERLQALLRDGGRLDNEIRENFQSLHAMLEELRDQRVIERPVTPIANIENRLNEAVRAVGLFEEPTFMLAAVPPWPLNLRSLFESREAPLVKLLEEPPEIRSSGFNISSDYNSRIHEGRLRRALIANSRLLELHRDGLTVFVTRGDQDGLCWGRQERQREAYLINQLVLIEMSYLFSLFVDIAFEGHLEPSSEVRMDLKMLRLALNSNHSYLESGPLSSYGSFNKKQAPNETFEGSIVYRYKEVSPERVAVLIIAEVYAWFGFEEECIPYTISAEEGRIINREAFAHV